jgi:hypothetical protein
VRNREELDTLPAGVGQPRRERDRAGLDDLIQRHQQRRVQPPTQHRLPCLGRDVVDLACHGGEQRGDWAVVVLGLGDQVQGPGSGEERADVHPVGLARGEDGAGKRRVGHEPCQLDEWLTATSTSDEEIDRIDRAVAALAQAHPLTPAAALLTDARHLQAKVQRVLTGGRLRHRQERELLRANGGVLAHMSLLLSDLQASRAADDYGNAALLYLREAAANEAIAWYVLAKNARWSHRYLLAADLASQGLRRGSSGPMTVQLACYEANASALAGDASRAKAAMRYAEEQAAALPAAQVTASPWSFPPERMTIFRLSVTLNTGDPDGALLAASDVGPSWEPSGRTSRRRGPRSGSARASPACLKTNPMARPSRSGRCWTCLRGCGSLP